MSTALSVPASIKASPQERAVHVMNKVDVVLSSSNQKNRQVLLFGHDESLDKSSKMNITTTTLENSNKNSNNNHDEQPSLVSSPRTKSKLTVDRMHSDGGSSTPTNNTSQNNLTMNNKKYFSRIATVSELKTQLQDCHTALLTMRQNANIKYRTLELEYVALTASMAQVQTELDHEQAKSQQLIKEKAYLQKQLKEALGTDQALWVQKLEDSCFQVGRKLALEKMEREELTEQHARLVQIMSECTLCQRRLPIINKQGKVAGLWGTLLSAVKDMDPSLGSEENEVMVKSNSFNSFIPSKAQPPPEMFIVQQQHSDLDTDISATEQQMSDDGTESKNQWGRSPKGHMGTKKKKSPGKKRSSSKKKVDAFGSLDDFFGAATAGLMDEEMDEEKSFFSMQRSVASSIPERRKKKKKRSKKETGAMSDDDERVKEVLEADELDSIQDRRDLMKAAGQSRKSFRERLMGLGAEVVAEEKSFAFKSSRGFLSPTSFNSEIATRTVRWEADALDRTEEDIEADKVGELAKEVKAWEQGGKILIWCYVFVCRLELTQLEKFTGGEAIQPITDF